MDFEKKKKKNVMDVIALVANHKTGNVHCPVMAVTVI